MFEEMDAHWFKVGYLVTRGGVFSVGAGEAVGVR